MDAAIASSGTVTIRSHPPRMMRRASGSGWRTAMPSALCLRPVARHDGARGEGSGVAVGAGALHADDLGFQAEQVAREDGAADAGAQADRHIHRVQVGHGPGTVPAHRSRRPGPAAARRRGRTAGLPVAASRWASSRASSKSWPCSISLAPKPAMAAFFSVLLPNGTTMVTPRPNRLPAKASDWPWLPRVAEIRPRPAGTSAGWLAQRCRRAP